MDKNAFYQKWRTGSCNRSGLVVVTSQIGKDIKNWYKRVNMMDILYIHIGKCENDTC
jgi:hypothetical protein